MLDQPGGYRFYCTFHATEDGRQGMAATMVVGDVTFYPGQEDGGPVLPPVKRASGVTRRVPEDHDTIQDAVDVARPGDLVLVGPGTYREEVKVAVPSLVIRGRDRDEVVVDGEFQRPNGIAVTADGVAVENLTVRNALINGLFWTACAATGPQLRHRLQQQGLRLNASERLPAGRLAPACINAGIDASAGLPRGGGLRGDSAQR